MFANRTDLGKMADYLLYAFAWMGPQERKYPMDHLNLVSRLDGLNHKTIEMLFAHPHESHRKTMLTIVGADLPPEGLSIYPAPSPHRFAYSVRILQVLTAK